MMQELDIRRLMQDNRTQARAIASNALDDLANPSVPLDAAVRKAIRVAALCGNPAMRAWLQLQVTDLTDSGRNDAMRIRRQIEAEFDEATARRVTTAVLDSYFDSRTPKSEPDKLYGPPISEIERLSKELD